MACIHETPTTDVTLPSFLRENAAGMNGKLKDEWLRSLPGESTRVDWKMFVPVSYAMQALHLDAMNYGIVLATTGRNRPYAQQEALFRSRFTTDRSQAKVPYYTRLWEGQVWYIKPGVALAATPGTSNHGWACADDVAKLDVAGKLVSIGEYEICWLKDHQADHGFALDIRSEAWHRHWYNRDALTQQSVDVLYANGVTVPDLSAFGFYVPNPTAQPNPIPEPEPEDDDMTPMYLAYYMTGPVGAQRKALLKGNGATCYMLTEKAQSGMEARKDWADKRMAERYVDVFTGEFITAWDQVPTVNANQVWIDLGKPDFSVG